MSCEHYKVALIKAAASETPLEGAIRDHVDACARCRSDFAGERALFAAIDTGMRRITNADVPRSFLPHLRASLLQDAAPRREPVPAWVAVVTSAALVFAIVMARSTHEAVDRLGRESALMVNSASSEKEIGRKTEPQCDLAELGAPKSKSAALIAAENHAGEPRAFVPAGQQAALRELVDGLLQGDIRGEELAAGTTRDGPVQELRISPVEVTPIVIQPLDEQSPEEP